MVVPKLSGQNRLNIRIENSTVTPIALQFYRRDCRTLKTTLTRAKPESVTEILHSVDADERMREQ